MATFVSLQEMKAFLGEQEQVFEVYANNAALYMAYDTGSTTLVTMTAGTYTASALASHLKTIIDAALTCTTTVSWSSTTEKFTISVPAGHTIRFVSTGSTGGFTIGFTTTTTAAVSMTSDRACSDPGEIISTLLSQVDVWIRSYCRREFESATREEVVIGNGSESIFVRETPITAITKISYRTAPVMAITNTMLPGAGYALVSVDGTNLNLNLNGTTTSIDIASYPTVSLLVSQVNSIGSGWGGSISGDYNNYPTSELITTWGQSAVGRYCQLYARDYSGYIGRVNTITGEIALEWSLDIGEEAIVDYVGGYTTIPEDLKLAEMLWVTSLWSKLKEQLAGGYGVKYWRLGDVSKSYDGTMPTEVATILGMYRRVM